MPKNLQTHDLNFNKWQSLIILAIFTVGIWLFLTRDKTDHPPEMDANTKAIIFAETGKDAVKAHLKDPGSAEFRNVYYTDHVAPVVCGEVNSRNAYGGMAGFQRFLAQSESLVIFESNSDEFSNAWNKLCVR